MSGFLKLNLICAVLLNASISAQPSEQRSLTAPPETKVVVWNIHNAGYNDRGAKKINVIMITDGKEIFRKNDIELPWESGKDTHVSLVVPTTATDTLRVEVTESVNGNPGLAEIEFVRDGKNLARKRRVKVNGVWEENSKCTGETLTDGITTSSKHLVGYWCAPVQEMAWAEIKLGTRN